MAFIETVVNAARSNAKWMSFVEVSPTWSQRRIVITRSVPSDT